MNTRQLTLVVTIAAIALVFVGIGYAYTAYTANESNNTDVAYITLSETQGTGSTAYTFTEANKKLTLDTYNEQSTTKIYYSLTGKNVGSYQCACLGTVNITAKYTGNLTDDVPTKLNVDVVSSSNFNASTDWVYFITDTPSTGDPTKIYAYKADSTSSTNPTETGIWTDGPNALVLERPAASKDYSSVTLSLYYGYLIKGTELEFDNKEFAKDLPAPQALTNGSVVFKATEITGDTTGRTPTTDTTLTTVTYKANGGNGDDVVKYVVTGTKVLANTDSLFTAPANKHFVGWNTSSTA